MDLEAWLSPDGLSLFYFSSCIHGEEQLNIRVFCSPNLWKFHVSAEMGNNRMCPWFWSFSLPPAIVSFRWFHVVWNLFVFCPSVPKASWVGIQILFGSSNKGLCRFPNLGRAGRAATPESEQSWYSQYKRGKLRCSDGIFFWGLCSNSTGAPRCCAILISTPILAVRECYTLTDLYTRFRCCIHKTPGKCWRCS